MTALTCSNDVIERSGRFEAPPRVLMLVPHEPNEDPRIRWVTNLCSSIGRTDILSTVYSPTYPSHSFDGNVFTERTSVGEMSSSLSRLAAQIGAQLGTMGPARRFIQYQTKQHEKVFAGCEADQASDETKGRRRGL